VTSVSVTPYTYTEDFVGDHAVLSRDNLKISFAVHTVWRVDDRRIPLFMERDSTTVTNGEAEKSPDAIVKVAYAHFVREPLRTYARDEVNAATGSRQRRAHSNRRRRPWTHQAIRRRQSVRHQQRRRWQRAVPVGGGRRRVAKAGRHAGARTEGHGIEIEREERTKREVQAAGIANAMQIIPRPAQRALRSARSDRSAEADGQFPQSHDRVHSVGPMGVPLAPFCQGQMCRPLLLASRRRSNNPFG
jgi:hypothetical protein